MSNSLRINRALVSVSDKTGLLEFVGALADLGVEIFSSGGTGRFLQNAGRSVQEISQYTGFPEMLDGRVKTLHPKVHGGILCRHDRPDDMSALASEGIVPFELVIVNLYPFEETVANPRVSLSDAIEQIDVGGPTLIRSAAKNHAFVTVVTSPAQYSTVVEQIRESGGTTPQFRRELAIAAFARTASYDRAIHRYLDSIGSGESDPPARPLFPDNLELKLIRKAKLRYGENPHQQAALYSLPSSAPTLVNADQLHGKELSYNNLLDLDSAWNMVRLSPQPAVVVIKHNNPCGAAIADDLPHATKLAMEGDPLSAFGSILGFNRPVDAASAEILTEPGNFVEAIIAPNYTAEAIEVLTTKPKWRENVRLIRTVQESCAQSGLHFRQIDGGFLAQQPDDQPDVMSEWTIVTKRRPENLASPDIVLAWNVVRHVKSNAIVICRQGALCGVGAGQMSRVDAVEMAIRKAGDKAQEAVLASDAFFPFADSIEAAAQAGIQVIIQPGGSRRDKEVIDASDRLGLAMIFTARRHFKH